MCCVLWLGYGAVDLQKWLWNMCGLIYKNGYEICVCVSAWQWWRKFYSLLQIFRVAESGESQIFLAIFIDVIYLMSLFGGCKLYPLERPIMHQLLTKIYLQLGGRISSVKEWWNAKWWKCHKLTTKLAFGATIIVFYILQWYIFAEWIFFQHVRSNRVIFSISRCS